MTSENYELYEKDAIRIRLMSEFDSNINFLSIGVSDKNGKVPNRRQWNNINKTRAEWEADIKASDSIGYGILLSGSLPVIGIDIDTEDINAVRDSFLREGIQSEAVDRFVSLCLEAPAYKSSRKDSVNRRKLFMRIQDPALKRDKSSTIKLKANDDTQILEFYFLTDKPSRLDTENNICQYAGQFVCQSRRELEDGTVSYNELVNTENDFPVLPKEFEAFVFPEKNLKKLLNTFQSDSVSEIEKKLNRRMIIENINDGWLSDYTNWTNLAMALHKETDGSDEALELFIKYSNMCPHSEVSSDREILTKWNSFGKRDGIGLGTILDNLKTENIAKGRIILDPCSLSPEELIEYLKKDRVQSVYANDFRLSTEAMNQFSDDNNEMENRYILEVMAKLITFDKKIQFITPQGEMCELLEAHKALLKCLPKNYRPTEYVKTQFIFEKADFDSPQRRLATFKNFELPKYTTSESLTNKAVSFFGRLAHTLARGICKDSKGNAIIHNGKELTQMDYLCYLVIDRLMNPSRNPNKYVMFKNAQGGAGKRLFFLMCQSVLGSNYCMELNDSTIRQESAKPDMMCKFLLNVGEFKERKGEDENHLLKELVDGTHSVRHLFTNNITVYKSYYLIMLSSNDMIFKAENERRAFYPNVIERNEILPKEVSMGTVEEYTKVLFDEFNSCPEIAMSYFDYLMKNPYDISGSTPRTEKNLFISETRTTPLEAALASIIKTLEEAGIEDMSSIDVPESLLTSKYLENDASETKLDDLNIHKKIKNQYNHCLLSANKVRVYESSIKQCLLPGLITSDKKNRHYAYSIDLAKVKDILIANGKFGATKITHPTGTGIMDNNLDQKLDEYFKAFPGTDIRLVPKLTND